MRKLFCLLTLLLLTQHLAHAFDFTGYVETTSGEKLYVEFQKAEKGKETFVFVNGLVYKTERWHQVSKDLAQKGYGIVHYDFEGQYRSYVKSMDEHEGYPDWLFYGMSLERSAQQLKEILETFKVERASVVGLSYGTTIAATFTKNYPEFVNNLVLMSPLVIPLDNYDPKGKAFRKWLDALDLWGPVGNYWSNFYYDLVYKWYYKDQGTLRNYDLGKWLDEYYKAVFHQVKAIRHYDLRKLGLEEVIDNKKIHLVTAGKEEQTYLPDQLKMWDLWSEEIKASHIHVQDAFHAIPDTTPGLVIGLLDAMAKKADYLFQGKSYSADVISGRYVLRINQ